MGVERDTDLAEWFARLALTLRMAGSTHRLLRRVAVLAVPTVPGAEYAGVVLARRREPLTTAAGTGPLVQACDLLQRETGEGPCLQALAEGNRTAVVVDDAGSDSRWPRFGRGAELLGVRSLLVCPLGTQGSPMGAVSWLSGRAKAFDERAVRIAVVYAAHAGAVLADRWAADSMRAALESRQSIGEACGILVERHRLTPRQAFDVLVRASQHLNVKLREVAAHVVRTGQDPELITAEDLRGGSR